MKRFILLLIFLIWSCRADLFDFLPTTPVQSSPHFSLSDTHESSDSLWASWFCVDSVHYKTLLHNDKDSSQIWKIGIGKGSQIFSLQGIFGEAVPPQNHPGAPWIDEVVQIIAVNREKNNREKVRTFEVSYEDTIGVEKLGESSCKDSAYFLHQAGSYQRDTLLQKNYHFSPILAEKETNNSFATICWPQQAHVHNIHTSNALYWQQIQDLDSGIIEILYGVYNFGDTPLDYFNMPWGGVRESVLPIHLLSYADGSLIQKSGLFSEGKSEKLKTTDGWALFTQNKKESAQTLSYVFGTDKYLSDTMSSQWDDSRWRYGSTKAMGGYPGIAPRDFFVAVVNPRVTIQKGEFFYWRWYMVVGTQKEVITKSKALRDSVEYGHLRFSAKDASIHNLYAHKHTISCNSSDSLLGSVYDRPAESTEPLFLMRHKEDSSVIVTRDPNIFNDSLTLEQATVYRPYLSKYRCEALLGFVSNTQFESITAKTPTLQSTLKSLAKPPILSMNQGNLSLTNVGSMESISIYNLKGQELNKLSPRGNRELHWRYEGSSNFLIIKCTQANSATTVLPLVVR